MCLTFGKGFNKKHIIDEGQFNGAGRMIRAALAKLRASYAIYIGFLCWSLTCFLAGFALMYLEATQLAPSLCVTRAVQLVKAHHHV